MNKRIELSDEDKKFFANLGDKFISAEEKEFFERMKYKLQFEPAPANDLILSEKDNEEGIYIVRCYDCEFIIGCCSKEVYLEEQYAMTFSDALATNLKECGFLQDNKTLWEWLRQRNYSKIQYNHNFNLM